MRRLIVLLVIAGFAPIAAVAQMLPERFTLLYQGKYASAVALGEKELQANPTPSNSKLLPLCIAYGRLQQYGKALSCLDRVEANVKLGDVAAFEEDTFPAVIFRNGVTWCFNCVEKETREGNRGTVLAPLHMLRAELYLELREYAKAIAFANEYLRAMPRLWIGKPIEPIFRMQPLAVAGIAHALSGNREEAEKAIKALEGVTVRAAQRQKSYGLARIYLALGEFRKAHQIFSRDDPSNVGWFESLIPHELDPAFSVLPLQFLKHRMQLEIGEAKAAKEGFDALLAGAKLKQNREIHWLVLNDRGRIAAQEGDVPMAIEFWKRAIDIIEQQRSTINTEALKIGFVGDKQAVYQAVIAALFEQSRYPEAFDFVERSKARALVDLLAGKNDFAVAAPDPEKIRELLASANAAELDSRSQVATREMQRSAELKSEAVAALRERAKDLASLVTVSSAPIADIQARLPEDEALIEYFYDDKSLYAFVLTREALRAVKLNGQGLDAEVRTMRKAVATPLGNQYVPVAQQLYARLIRPLEGLFSTKKLLIVPHGVLHYLPFVALRDDAGFVIDRFSFRFLPSASVIRYLRGGGAAGRAGILAFGNPDLGDPKFDLGFAQEEALAIVQKMPQSRALVRKEATESAFRQYAAGFSYLHFATHGEFNADAPLRSALRLAKDEHSDGLLTLDKLYATRIDAEMVTLSACETGLGKVANGDDVVGLTRGFLYAGTSTVVATLWKVDDRATSALMTRFYDELKSRDKREALRTAQLATRAQFPHPFFWAAFQLTGEAR